MGKRLIAFTLWGDKDLYNLGAIMNVRYAQEVYPGWTCRFYVHEKSPILTQLKCLDCEVVVKPHEAGYRPLLWRFLAASDPEADYIIFRDCDSRVNTREAWAVKEWIASGKDAHLMKDAPAHNVAIMAGMWGIRGGVIRTMEAFIIQWALANNTDAYTADQDFLKAIIWPMIRGSALSHGHSNSEAGPALPFPKHPLMRVGEYVGQLIKSDLDGLRKELYGKEEDRQVRLT